VHLAVFVSISISLLVAIMLPIAIFLLMRGEHGRKMRARRLADVRMNARLLKLDI